MPVDPTITAGVITAAAEIGGQAYNQQSIAKSNLKSREFADYMYGRQRADALSDWNMQNEYNSPVEQRKRMIAAGMNPALMYGSGGSAGLSQPVRSSSMQDYHPQAPQINAGAGLSAVYDVMRTVAQTQLLNAQTNLARSSTSLNVAKTSLTDSEQQKLQSWLDGLKTYNGLPVTQSEVDSGQYQSTDTKRNFQSENMWLDLHNKWQSYVNAFNDNDRRAVFNAASVDNLIETLSAIRIREAKDQAEIDQIKANTDLLKKAAALKQINIDGQNFMNSRFDSPILRIFLGLLNRADILR